MYFEGFLPCQTLSNFLYVHTTELIALHWEDKAVPSLPKDTCIYTFTRSFFPKPFLI